MAPGSGVADDSPKPLPVPPVPNTARPARIELFSTGPVSFAR